MSRPTITAEFQVGRTFCTVRRYYLSSIFNIGKQKSPDLRSRLLLTSLGVKNYFFFPPLDAAAIESATRAESAFAFAAASSATFAASASAAAIES